MYAGRGTGLLCFLDPLPINMRVKRRISMQNKALVRVFMMAGLIGLFGCNQSPSTSSNPPASGPADSSTGNSAQSAEQRPPAPLFAPKPIIVPAGKAISVTVDQTVSSETSHEGEYFDASLAAPRTDGGKVVISAGARARGTVTVAQSDPQLLWDA